MTLLGGPFRDAAGISVDPDVIENRRCEKAREVAETSIRQLFELFRSDSGCDLGRFARLGVGIHDSTFNIGIARSIGPLVEYYRATGYGPALELATFL